MNMLQTACTRFEERRKALGLKGKKADEAALHYLCGFATALEATKHPEAEHVTTVIAMVIAVRGAIEVALIADKAAKG